MIDEIKKNEVLQKMKRIRAICPVGSLEYVDAEEAHEEADELLCSLLAELGYNEIVEVYKGIKKWYS